jgi:hypothetical protein
MMLCQIELPWGAQCTGWHVCVNMPSAWRATNSRPPITFGPELLPYTMRHTNRPSGIQHVASFFGVARGNTGR